MMPQRETIMMLRIPLLILLVALAIAAITVFASLQFKSSQSLIHGSASAELAQARNKLQAAQMEEKNLQAFSANFRELSSRGLFSDEKRLDWFEHIKRLATEHHIITLEFGLEPQHALPPNGAAPNIEVLASPLHLKMALVHEEDLLNFLNALRNQPKGFYSAKNCSLKRAVTDTRSEGANIEADCTLDWMSFKPKNPIFRAG